MEICIKLSQHFEWRPAFKEKQQIVPPITMHRSMWVVPTSIEQADSRAHLQEIIAYCTILYIVTQLNRADWNLGHLFVLHPSDRQTCKKFGLRRAEQHLLCSWSVHFPLKLLFPLGGFLFGLDLLPLEGFLFGLNGLPLEGFFFGLKGFPLDGFFFFGLFFEFGLFFWALPRLGFNARWMLSYSDASVVSLEDDLIDCCRLR